MDTLILWAVILFFYFGPTLAANHLDHRNTSAIFLLNLFLGWTFVGWVGALVWAFMESSDKK